MSYNPLVPMPPPSIHLYLPISGIILYLSLYSFALCNSNKLKSSHKPTSLLFLLFFLTPVRYDLLRFLFWQVKIGISLFPLVLEVIVSRAIVGRVLGLFDVRQSRHRQRAPREVQASKGRKIGRGEEKRGGTGVREEAERRSREQVGEREGRGGR